MSDSPNNDASGNSNTDSTNSPSSSSSMNWGVGILIGLIVGIVIAFLFQIKKQAGVPVNSLLTSYPKYFISTYVGTPIKKFFSFLPLIFIVFGFLSDAINQEFQASKISIATLSAALFESVIGGRLFNFYKGLFSKASQTLESSSLFNELIPSLYENCKVILTGFALPATDYGGGSMYSFTTFFTIFSYIIPLYLISNFNPSLSNPYWWIAPVVMAGLSIIGILIRVLSTDSCDTGISTMYGIFFAAILSASYMAISYFGNQSLMPFSNKVFGSGSTLPSSVSSTENIAKTTTKSCGAIQGEGVIYEIYQDGQMIGKI